MEMVVILCQPLFLFQKKRMDVIINMTHSCRVIFVMIGMGSEKV